MLLKFSMLLSHPLIYFLLPRYTDELTACKHVLCFQLASRPQSVSPQKTWLC